MGTAVVPTPTPVQRPPEKPVQRTAHTSAVGHGLGIGVNAALYAFGTYGWGTAAAIGGVTAAWMGATRLHNRRGRGLLGGRGRSGGGLLGRLGGGGRGRGLGIGGRSRRGLVGGSHGGGGGFLRRLAGNRSSTPRSRGGLPGRGVGGRGGGLLGRKSSRGGLLGGTRGGSGGFGGRSPGSRRGGGGLLSGRGSRGNRGLGGGGRGGLAGSRSGRRGGLLSRLNPFRVRNPGSRRNTGGGIGRRAKNGGRRLLGWINPFRGKKRPPKNKKQHQQNQSPWKEVPLNPNRTKWEYRTMGDAPVRRPVPKPGAGSSGGGRGLTAAAEQFAETLAKPPTEVNTLKTFDHNLGDLADAISALQTGMKNHTAVVEAGMPAETYAHEQLTQMTRQLGQMAEQAKVLQADARRRLALDHERVDTPRPNEGGYDYTNNR